MGGMGGPGEGEGWRLPEAAEQESFLCLAKQFPPLLSFWVFYKTRLSPETEKDSKSLLLAAVRGIQRDKEQTMPSNVLTGQETIF